LSLIALLAPTGRLAWEEKSLCILISALLVVSCLSEERPHSDLNSLCPVDYHKGNPQELLTERERRLKETATKQKELNSQVFTETMVGG